MTDGVAEPIDVATPGSKLIVGKIRNGELTHAETRYSFELEDYDGAVFVLTLLPPNPEPLGRQTLVDAIEEISGAMHAAYGSLGFDREEFERALAGEKP